MKISSRLVQYIFFVLFVLSVGTGLMFVRYQESLVVQAAQMQENGQSSAVDLAKLLEKKAAGYDISVISMLVSLAGFVVSTVMNVRKDRRETKEAALAMQQKNLELEKLRMELDAMKKKVERGGE